MQYINPPAVSINGSVTPNKGIENRTQNLNGSSSLHQLSHITPFSPNFVNNNNNQYRLPYRENDLSSKILGLKQSTTVGVNILQSYRFITRSKTTTNIVIPSTSTPPAFAISNNKYKKNRCNTG
ncbi:hypothetical protein RRG08_045771 [Elysia crispata]|uniref:Uncharacterized protein n=1 Tax=Elysia crispata TaxID=231223 RepID=A0AAE1AZ13_9GAST|nr:hypothetical protein RRG08_045771 [Elysia crispata]